MEIPLVGTDLCIKDWLETAQVNGKPWSKSPPAPRLPREVVENTAAKYREALQRLTAGDDRLSSAPC